MLKRSILSSNIYLYVTFLLRSSFTTKWYWRPFLCCDVVLQVSLYCVWNFYLWGRHYTENLSRRWGGLYATQYYYINFLNFLFIRAMIFQWWWLTRHCEIRHLIGFGHSCFLMLCSWWISYSPFWCLTIPTVRCWLVILARYPGSFVAIMLCNHNYLNLECNGKMGSTRWSFHFLFYAILIHGGFVFFGVHIFHTCNFLLLN